MAILRSAGPPQKTHRVNKRQYDVNNIHFGILKSELSLDSSGCYRGDRFGCGVALTSQVSRKPVSMGEKDLQQELDFADKYIGRSCPETPGAPTAIVAGACGCGKVWNRPEFSFADQNLQDPRHMELNEQEQKTLSTELQCGVMRGVEWRF